MGYLLERRLRCSVLTVTMLLTLLNILAMVVHISTKFASTPDTLDVILSNRMLRLGV